MLHNLFLKFID